MRLKVCGILLVVLLILIRIMCGFDVFTNVVMIGTLFCMITIVPSYVTAFAYAAAESNIRSAWKELNPITVWRCISSSMRERSVIYEAYGYYAIGCGFNRNDISV